MTPLRLRVATFNIHGGRPRVGPADLEATARALADLGADLVGLQEVHRRLPPPYSFQDQPARLRRLLREEVHFCPCLRVGPCAYGLATLSRLPLLRSARRRLPGRREPRCLSVAWLAFGGTEIRFLNTHLGLTREERQEQARVVAEEIAREATPTIVAGDLNAAPTDAEVRLLESGGLSHCGGPEVRTFPCDAPASRLDYLLVTRHFRIARAWAVETEVSDHLPLTADLELTPEGT